MVGGLEAGRRVAAAALLALGSMVPHNGPLLAAPAQIAPVADTGVACPLTVGTATTDPALANDAARAIAVGYAVDGLHAGRRAPGGGRGAGAHPDGHAGSDDAGSRHRRHLLGHRRHLLRLGRGGDGERLGRGHPADHREPDRRPRATTTSDTDDVATPTRPTTPARRPARRRRTTEPASGPATASSSDGDTDDQVDSGANSGVTDDGDTGSPTTGSPTTDSPTHRRHRDGGRHVRLGHPHGRRGLRRRHCRTGASTTVRATPATAAAPRPR